MIIRSFKEHLSKRITKIVILIAVYIFFTIFSVSLYHKIPTVYKNIQNFFHERILSNKRSIVISGTTLLVEVADTKEKREKGLSGHSPLLPHSGMIFIFEKPNLYGFWMKDMTFDIDIIWFNEYGEVIYILSDAKPESYPETFLPPKKSLYVLEVPAGLAKKEGIKIGDKIDLY